MKYKELSRDTSIDILRIIATFAVILIHTTGHTLFLSGFDILRLPINLAINQLFRFAVPMFFIISGFVLGLRYKNGVDGWKFAWKRAMRVIPPYIFWSVVYFLIIDKNTLVDFWKNIGPILLYGLGANHLYFVPGLILLYLLFPIILTLIEWAKGHERIWPIPLVIQLLLLFWDYSLGELPLVPPLRVAILNLGLFILGILVSRDPEKVKALVARYWFVLVGVVIVFGAVVVGEARDGYLILKDVHPISSQWRVSMFFYTSALFLLLWNVFQGKFSKRQSVIKRVAALTFCIYFIHEIFLKLFWKLIGAYLFSATAGHIVEAWWFDLSAFTFTAGLSILAAYILAKIPYIHNLVGIGDTHK